MKNAIYLLFLVLAIGVAITLYINGKNDKEYQYINSIKKYRTEKDMFFATSPQSPFGKGGGGFTKLKYFEPNSDYKVEGMLTILDDTLPRYMSMTNKKMERFVRYGYVDFKLKSQTSRLYVYIQPTDDYHTQKLFIPFNDHTNGKTTYTGGRYLDITLPTDNSKKVQLDFNLAYNPYCVYNYNFACPIPPQKNNLNMAIEAGEQLYETATK